MVMTFSDNSIIPDDCFSIRDAGRDSAVSCVRESYGRDLSESGRFPHIIEEKLAIPDFGGILKRPRLDKILQRSLARFGATLVSGRSGTGKTALAAEYARGQKHVAWFSVESPEIEWRLFANYFAASLRRAVGAPNESVPAFLTKGEVSETQIENFLTWAFGMYEDLRIGQMLIVLDDLHHIFDAPWFGQFFNLLIHSLPHDVSLLLVCRSRPPAPLWRLRSKQMLNVIDEKLLAFSGDETKRFFKRAGLPEKLAQKAHDDSFGRIAKVKQIANRASSTGI